DTRFHRPPPGVHHQQTTQSPLQCIRQCLSTGSMPHNSKESALYAPTLRFWPRDACSAPSNNNPALATSEESRLHWLPRSFSPSENVPQTDRNKATLDQPAFAEGSLPKAR